MSGPDSKPPSPGEQSDALLKYTRQGFHRGINSGAHRDYSWIVKATGTLTGGVAGWYISKRMLRTTMKQHSAIATYAQVPIVIFGTITSAALGKELALPAASAGIKTGKTFRWTLEGLQYDVFGKESGVRPSWEKQESRLGKYIGSAMNRGSQGYALDVKPGLVTSEREMEKVQDLLRQVEHKEQVLTTKAGQALVNDNEASSMQSKDGEGFSAKLKWPTGSNSGGVDGEVRVVFDNKQKKSPGQEGGNKESPDTAYIKVSLPGLGELEINEAKARLSIQKEKIKLRGEDIADAAQELASLRLQKKALKEELSGLRSPDLRREVRQRLITTDRAMKDLKRSIKSRYSASLAKEIDKDIQHSVEELKALRVREKFLKNKLKIGLHSLDAKEELQSIRQRKALLKERVLATHGVRISKV